MLDQLHLILQQDCALDDTQPLLVGVSGGPDSLFLMDVLDKLGYSLVIAHLNHRLRLEADEDARAVQRMAEARGISCILGEVDVRAHAVVHQFSIEEAARMARYRFLFEQAVCCNAQAVAVAHTADDQVETVLMHLLRGTGLSGLRGMAYRTLPNPWNEKIPLVRPLLGVWRKQVIAYCDQNKLDPLFDCTNLDTVYFRNRLRHELIPYLEGYNPRVRELIWRMACTLSADYDVLSKLTDDAWSGCVRVEGLGWLSLATERLLAHPLAVQRSVIRKAIFVLRPTLRDLSFDAVERALDRLTNPPQTRQCDLVAGLRLVWEDIHVYLAAWEADLPLSDWPQWLGDAKPLKTPGKLKLPAGWRITTTIEEGKQVYENACQNDDPYQAWLAVKQESTLTLRTRCPGDRFRPLGMGGSSVKLADYFINRKLPRRARNAWPLICVGDKIAWVPGYHLAHPFRLTEKTRRAVHLVLHKA